jgi:hypothetical protein
MGADVNGHMPSRQEATCSRCSTEAKQEIAMFRNSTLLAAVLAFAAIGSTISASNATVLSIGIAVCPAGTHPGYEAKYCWKNHETEACPAGFHLGYEGKYCWRNH